MILLCGSAPAGLVVGLAGLEDGLLATAAFYVTGLVMLGLLGHLQLLPCVLVLFFSNAALFLVAWTIGARWRRGPVHGSQDRH